MTQWGVAVDGYSAENVRAFEDATGTTVQTVLGYGSGSGSWSDMDPSWLFSQDFLGSTGKPVNISMPMAPDDAGVEVYRDIADGLHREDHRQWAETILAAAPQDGSPIYVRTAWEMPGEWFSWGNVAQEDPEAMKGAWRQFADVFHEVSDRFQMVWDFNSDRGPVEHLYPGDDAVDVIGQDIYWSAELQGGDPEEAWAKHADGYERGLNWMADFAAEHGKPMAISEWGSPSTDSGEITAEESARWIDLFSGWVQEQNADGDPGVVYMNWWNVSEAYSHDSVVDAGDEVVSAALGGMASAVSDGSAGEGDREMPEENEVVPEDVAEDTTEVVAEGPVDAVAEEEDPDGADEPDEVVAEDPVEEEEGGGRPDDVPPVDGDPPEHAEGGQDEEPIDWNAIAADYSAWFDLTQNWNKPDGWSAGDPLPGSDGGGGGGGEGGFTYPALGDWGAWGPLVLAEYEETGDWNGPDEIIASGWEPGGGPDGGGGGGGYQYPAPDDWPAVAALVEAEFAATGDWTSFEDIVSSGWTPESAGSIFA